MIPKQLEFVFDLDDVDDVELPIFPSLPPPVHNKPAESKWHKPLGHRVIVASHIEPGTTDEDIQHLRRYSDLSYPMELSSMTFERLSLFEKRMTAEFPWMINVIRHVRKQCYLRLVLNRPVFYIRPLLIVGRPGIGKTRFLRRLGEELDIPLAMLAISGSTDNRELDGTSRGWSNGDASFPVKLIARKKCPNPIIVLDEIDKESESNRNGRMTDSLHQLLEPENAKYWRDSFLCTEVDLSHITWLASANRIDDLAPSLLSRFTIVKVRKPEGNELFSVAHGAIKDFAKVLKIEPEDIPPMSELEWAVLEDMLLTRNPSCRVVVKWIQAVLEEKLESPDTH